MDVQKKSQKACEESIDSESVARSPLRKVEKIDFSQPSKSMRVYDSFGRRKYAERTDEQNKSQEICADSTDSESVAKRPLRKVDKIDFSEKSKSMRIFDPFRGRRKYDG